MKSTSASTARRWTHTVAAVLLAAVGIAYAEGSPLRVTASAPHLVLGKDREAVLTIESATPLSELTLTANRGQVEGVQRTGPGSFTARYVAPRQSYPQLAIVSAAGRTSGGALDGWLALPLWGQGEAVVRTSPRARVSVRIEQQLFGPVQADERGIGTVRVVVPPGVRYAYHGDKPIDLQLPAVPRHHVVLEQTRVPADEPAQVGIRVYALTPSGEPLTSVMPELSVSFGTLGKVAAEEPGAYRTVWSLPAGRAGSVQLATRLPGNDSAPVTFTLERPPGRPARLTLASEMERVVAGMQREVPLRAELKDIAGNLTPGEIHIESDFGTLSPPQAPSPGVAVASLAVPPRLQGRQRLHLRALAAGGLSAGLELPLATGPRSTIAVEPPQATLGDEALLTLRVVVQDAFGNPIADAAPTVSADLGAIQPGPADGSGRFAFVYRPPELEGERRATVSIRSGELTTSSDVRLVPAARWLSVGLKGGMLSNLGNVTSPYAALEAGGWTRLGGQQVGLLLEGSYFTFSRKAVLDIGELTGAPFSGKNDFVSATLTAAWRLRLGARWLVWTGVGGGLTHVTSRTQVSEQTPTVETGWMPAAHLSAGGGWRLGRGLPFAELRLGWGRDPAMATLAGTLYSVTASVGYRLELF